MAFVGKKDSPCHLTNVFGCLLSKMWSGGVSTVLHFRASKNVRDSQENRCVMPYEILNVLILWLVREILLGGVAKCDFGCNSKFAHDVGEKYL